MQDVITYCEKHPTREATLRCIRCNRLMCTDCIVPSSVGYICKECSRRHDDKFFNVEAQDYPIVGAVCAIANGVACMLAILLGSWWLAIFIGGAVGGVAGTYARRFTSKRVGRQSTQFAVIGAIVGAVLAPIVYILLRFGQFILDLNVLWAMGGLPVVVCTVGFAIAVYGIFQRKI